MKHIDIIKIRMAAIALLMLANLSTAFAQEQTVKHIVERGETIEAIATKYGVTKEEIIKLNPDAAQFVYVGMELTVPKKANQETIKENPVVTSNTYSANKKSPETSHAYTQTNSGFNKVKIGIVAGYSINNYVGKDIKDTKNKSGFHVGLDLCYQINENLFAEGSLGIATKGYKKEEFETSGVWDDEGGNYDITTKTTMSTTNLEIPLYVGANFDGFFIKAGPYFSYVLSGKMKSDVKDIIYEDIHSSSEGNNTYETKISDMKDFKRLTVGVGAGIGYCFDNFLIQFTYQRGLTKLFKKSKQYEQNMLISLGYFF